MCDHRDPPGGSEHTLGASGWRGSDREDERGDCVLVRAARSREEPESAASAPWSGVGPKRSRSPRTEWRTWRGGCGGGTGPGRQVRAPGDDERRPRMPLSQAATA
ncbi:hypothetical protein NDU88_004578 [Pleurodeles waltl]|uniref:Uncharacterized protein n=1 Tax=Pleurodeles waltl TaxID=8319 RepID=A0AAV7RG43_PLEWA|nr:hypothetical protein NDU88_004578 [Pleurodeles waltl]